MKNSYHHGNGKQLNQSSGNLRVNQVSHTMHSSSVITDDPDAQTVQVANTNQKEPEYSPQQFLGSTTQIGVTSIPQLLGTKPINQSAVNPSGAVGSQYSAANGTGNTPFKGRRK